VNTGTDEDCVRRYIASNPAAPHDSIDHKVPTMPDLLTPAITIAGGLIVFGATQIAQRFALDPVTDLMKALGRAAYVVAFYCNPDVEAGPWEDAKKELRKSASELEANLRGVRLHGFFCLIGQIPAKETAKRIITLLRGLANVHHVRDQSLAVEERRLVEAECNEVKRLLGI
jgi:hypothetical protein